MNKEYFVELVSKALGNTSSTDFEYIKIGQFRFFCVQKDHQEALNYSEIKKELSDKLKINEPVPFIQIIGDSSRFSAEGTQVALNFLHSTLYPKKCLILWGSIGSPLKDDGVDVNELVNLWLEEHPEKAKTTLANIVDKHSTQAVTEWGCSFSKVATNYFLVYGDAKFGDDIHSSDNLADQCLVFEGGVQTFAQIVNLLEKNKPISGIYHLRGTNNPEYYDLESHTYFSCFSAAEFVDQIKTIVEKQEASPKNELIESLEHFKENYLKNNHLFNPNKPGTENKEKLFTHAWKKFISFQLWDKLGTCSFSKLD